MWKAGPRGSWEELDVTLGGVEVGAPSSGKNMDVEFIRAGVDF